MRKLLLSCAAAIGLIASAPSAFAFDPLALATAESGVGAGTIGSTALIFAWPVAMVGLVIAHQKYTKGELKASASDATFGGEERMAQSTATPAYAAVAVNYNPQRDAIMAQWQKISGDSLYAYAGK